MRTPVDERLRAEAAVFELRFACEDCAHFDREPERGARRCGFGWPPDLERGAIRGPELAFCKDFELG